MERQAALHILRALAQGIDPHTGEHFCATSAYQHPDTVRALFQAVEALTDPPGTPTRSAAARPDRHSAPANAGKPWTEEEDKALAERFDAGSSSADLASQHQRTRAAIQARLVKLGKIEPPAEPPRFSRLAAAACAV
jgi:hypothetical protein